MAIQLSAAKTSLQRLKHDISDIDDVAGTFIEWCNFANRQIYNYLLGIDLDRFVTTQTYSSVTSGSQALPSDLHTMRGLGLGVFVVDDSGTVTDRRLGMTGYGSTRQGYYFDRGSIVFTGIEKATTFIMRYLPQPTTFTLETEYFTLDGTDTGVEIIPDFYLQALRDDLARLYSQWDEDIGMESISDFRFSNTLSDMQQFMPRTPRAKSIPFYNSAY
jgi:hypothetical protein